MAKRTKEEIHKLYDAYGEDEAGMYQFIKEHAGDMAKADKLSKKFLSIIMKEFGKNDGTSPLMLIIPLAKAAADIITAFDLFGYDGDKMEEVFCDCLSMSRIVSEKQINSEESEG